MPICKRVFCFFTSICLCISFVLVWFHPVEAHADVGEFAGALDYMTSLPSSDLGGVVSGLSSDAGVVAGLMIGLYIVSQNPLQTGDNYVMDSTSSLTGIYVVDGVYKPATVYVTGSSHGWLGSGGFAVAFSDDFQLSVLFSSSGAVNFSTSGNYCNVTAISSVYTTHLWQDNKGFFTPVTFDNRFNSSGFSVNLSGGVPSFTRDTACPVSRNSYPLRTLLGSGTILNYPSGDFDPSNPSDYINNVLRPYVEINYPDGVYIIEDPVPTPQYPTDFVTGIPKDWTIENPPLPTSPNVSLSPRDADFSVINPSEAVAQNATAFDFWWWLTDRILTYTDMKNIVVLFVGLGAVSYILWRIGR